MPLDALRTRRCSIAAELRELTAALTHLDATIKLFEPGYRAPRGKRGELVRAILDALRDATEPMSTQEVADAVGMDAKRVGVALYQQARKGVVRAEGRGRGTRWGDCTLIKSTRCCRAQH
jgi:hypothetical protein